MGRSSIREWLRRSPVDKVASLRHRYWALKTAIYYRPQFAAIGSRTVIYAPLMIAHPENIELGEGVLIRDGVRLEVVRDRYGRIPRLSIGSNTNIEQNVHIVCHSRVMIGSSVSITGRCAIVDVTHPFRDVHCPEKIGARIADEDSFVEIGDGTFLGYGAVILPNVRIGRSCVIGANSVVSKDVPDYSIAAGTPAVVLETFDFETNAWRRVARAEGTKVFSTLKGRDS